MEESFKFGGVARTPVANVWNNSLAEADQPHGIYSKNFCPDHQTQCIFQRTGYSFHLMTENQDH